MADNVIPLPVAFKPHPVHTNTVLFGDTLEDFTPRQHFGLRAPTGEALFNIPRRERKDEQDRIKRAACEARNAFDRKHVCPSLDAALAARMTQLAGIALILADEAKMLGLLKACCTLRDLAHHAETASAEIEAEIMPEPA
jgi:hypothetical protein